MTVPSHGRMTPVRVHFDELDAMGLLHHSRYALLFERAAADYWAEHGWSPDPRQSAFTEAVLAVRELSISYHVPIIGVCEPVVHFWLESVGRSSLVYGFRILSADRSVVHAEGRRVNVNVDPVAMGPAPLSDKARQAAELLLTETATY
ncbi:hotdog domain-containing protein [Actinoplanes sp. NPDC023936]|uniref:acyl-CoA thioesterase n=1 Tax=Actinoplanes sp. NPDC023936 TaxID=3154910 RepID=UPI0033DA32D0